MHLVFTPKYRRGPFTSAILDRCEEIMAEFCTDSVPNCANSMAKPITSTCSCTTRRKSRYHDWSTASKASPPGAYAKSSPPTSANTCGANISGPPPTSQAPSATHHHPSSRTTSKTRNAPPKPCPRYTPAQNRDAIPPAVNDRGSSQESAETTRVFLIRNTPCLSGCLCGAPAPARGSCLERLPNRFYSGAYGRGGPASLG